VDKNFIEVTVGPHTLHFDVENADINKYLNQQGPNNKIQSAFNMLSTTVVDDDKEAFKSVALIGSEPVGLVVIQIATIVAGEFGGDLEIAIKKPSNSSKASSKTASAK